MASVSIRAEVGDGASARTLTLSGRTAWALLELCEAGERGCTPIDTPGPRWSAYVHKLRRLGIAIETLHESHGGEFPGCHARYVLRAPVRVLSAELQNSSRRPARFTNQST